MSETPLLAFVKSLSPRPFPRSLGPPVLAIAATGVFGAATIVPIASLLSVGFALTCAPVLIPTALLLGIGVSRIALRASTPDGAVASSMCLFPLGWAVSCAVAAMIGEIAAHGSDVGTLVAVGLYGAIVGFAYALFTAPKVYAGANAIRNPSHDDAEPLLLWVALLFASAAWLGASRFGSTFRSPGVALLGLAIACVLTCIGRDTDRLTTLRAIARRAIVGHRVIENDRIHALEDSRVVPYVRVANASCDAVVVRDRVSLTDAYRKAVAVQPVALVTRERAREEHAVESRIGIAIVVGALVAMAAWRAAPSLAHGVVRPGLIEMIGGRTAGAEEGRIRSAMQIYRDDHPNSCPSVDDLRRDGQLDRNASALDPWGHAYRLRCDGEAIEVHSAGRDGRWGTFDDIPAVTAPTR